MQPARTLSPALTAQEYKKHEKKPPSVEAASFKLKLCRDSRPHTIGYLYSYYNSFFVIVNLPPNAKPPPAPQCRDRYPQLKHTLPDYG